MCFHNKFARREVYYNIKSFFKSEQAWLVKQIPRTYCDKVELLPQIMFAILVDFVETERGLRHLDEDWSEGLEAGYVSRLYIDSRNEICLELKAVYDYINVERNQLGKQLNEFYPRTSLSFKDYFIPLDDESGAFTMRSAQEIYGMSFEEAYGEVHRIEKLIDEKDLWAMQTICKHSKYLWT